MDRISVLKKGEPASWDQNIDILSTFLFFVLFTYGQIGGVNQGMFTVW